MRVGRGPIELFATLSLLAFAGCGQRGEASRDTAKTTAAATATASPSSSASAASVAPTALPTEWPALGDGKNIIHPKVSHYAPSKTPTLVVFFATWCGGCVASVLSDADLKRRFSPKVRVGLALVDNKEADFDAFTKTLRASLDIDVWADDDATKALKKTCGVSSIPAACLLDADQKVVWTGHPGNASPVLGNASDYNAASARAREAIDAAVAAPADAALRNQAFASATGFAGLENEVAWDLALKGKGLELAAGLARDATISTGGFDYASLDTYGFALWKLGRREDAYTVASRVVAVCDLLDPHSCSEERARYEQFKKELGK